MKHIVVMFPGETISAWEQSVWHNTLAHLILLRREFLINAGVFAGLNKIEEANVSFKKAKEAESSVTALGARMKINNN